MRALPSCLAGLITALVLLVPGCGDGGAPVEGHAIAVTNSYLECAVRDLWGEDVGILCLAPPGMCPGHFDISPAQVRQLKGCQLLLLFDFQQQIMPRLERLRDSGLDMQPVQSPSGLCMPDTYLAVCRQVCHLLSRSYPEREACFEGRLAAIERRLNGLALELRGAVASAGATGACVVASNHQAGFARWLGLEPVSTFIGSDQDSLASLYDCARKAEGKDIRVVIANRQEGTTLAQGLADMFQTKAVVFSNFPEASEDGFGFDRLLRDNVGALCETVAQ